MNNLTGTGGDNTVTTITSDVIIVELSEGTIRPQINPNVTTRSVVAKENAIVDVGTVHIYRINAVILI